MKKKKKGSLFAPKIKKAKKKDTYNKDEDFYEKAFNNCENHRCEECGEKLPDTFSFGGKVIAKWRYSHIIAKSIAPHLRYVIKNINHLCFLCHQKWDFGDKKEMKIYEKNRKNFPQYLK